MRNHHISYNLLLLLIDVIAIDLSQHPFLLYYVIFPCKIGFQITGRARLIQTRLIRSSTKFEVSLNIWQDCYHFMFKMHG